VKNVLSSSRVWLNHKRGATGVDIEFNGSATYCSVLNCSLACSAVNFAQIYRYLSNRDL
jgi:hypothetical protein